MHDTTTKALLAQEWRDLQAQYEQHEQNALWIKLFAIGLYGMGLAFKLHELPQLLLVLICWVQEAILRTVQNRLGERLLRLESYLKDAQPPEGCAMQLHAAWQASRPGTRGLLREYLSHAMRPTVAFPYIVLAGLTLLLGVYFTFAH